jgi:uncharacterized iron-regulated membrane protein
MRTFHRIAMTFVVPFALYMGITGSLMQSIDLRAILGHAPASDPNMQSIREGIYGPPNFQVIAPVDYGADPLPVAFSLADGLATVIRAARSEVGDAPFDYVELRMANGKPLGQVLTRARVLRFDATSGAALGAPPTQAASIQTRSQHDVMKRLHRMGTSSKWSLWLNLATAIGLLTLIVGGLMLYFKLLIARARAGRSGMFWSGGGPWRVLHRAICVVAAAFILEIAITGTLLAADNIAVSFFLRAQSKLPLGSISPVRGSQASPLIDADLPAMLRTTIAASENAAPDAPIKVVRLRYFAAIPQGVVITGGEETRQLVFNAASGRKAFEYEPGYPITGFPFGWEEHEIVKRIHRGDYFGLPGRWTDLLAGLSLIALACSGLAMYLEMWSKRRRSGRWNPLWR